MSNIPGYLKWVISITLTLFIISTGIQLFNKTKPVMEVVSAAGTEQARLMEDAQYAGFNYQLVSGSQILTAMRKYYDKEPFYLYVQSKTNGITKNFGMQPSGSTLPCSSFDYTTGKLSGGQGTCSVTEENVMDINSSYYIEPQARFRSKIVRDANYRITAIYFQAQ